MGKSRLELFEPKLCFYGQVKHGFHILYKKSTFNVWFFNSILKRFPTFGPVPVRRLRLPVVIIQGNARCTTGVCFLYSITKLFTRTTCVSRHQKPTITLPSFPSSLTTFKQSWMTGEIYFQCERVQRG